MIPDSEEPIDYQPIINVSEDKLSLVGNGWYGGFAARHPTLVAKIVVKYGTKKSEWVTKDVLTLMYNKTYFKFVKSGIALELD